MGKPATNCKPRKPVPRWRGQPFDRSLLGRRSAKLTRYRKMRGEDAAHARENPDAPNINPDGLSLYLETLSSDPEALGFNPDAVRVDPESLSVDPETLTLDPDALSFDPETSNFYADGRKVSYK